ncbi:MAG: hypothetical protein ACFHWX_02490 [Bacteroidota bacterium]
MKHLIPISLMAVLLATACQEEPIEVQDIVVEEEQQDLMELLVRDLKENSGVMDQAFSNVASYYNADSIQKNYKKAESKSAFIKKMSAVNHDLFIKAVEETSASMSGYLKIGDIKGESTDNASEAFVRLLISKDPLGVYYDNLNTALADANHDKWVIIESFQGEAGTSGEALPTEEVTLNFEKIKSAIKFKDILVSSLEEDERATEMEGFISEYKWGEVMVGLLLPAVQSFSETTENTPVKDWLNTEIKLAINGGLHRDIIRRFQAAGLAGGLELVINEDFDNSDQYTAMFDLMHAQYQASLHFIWGEVYDQMSL